MFIPRYFQVNDMDEVLSFMQQYSFVTVVTTKKGRPIATHVPVQVVQEGTDTYITGHVAYGNPQWRTFEASEHVLVIFQGPHAYISSSWYGHENVPTWNYQAVHVYGKATILSDEELRQDLARLLEKYEGHRTQPVLWETLSTELLESQLKGIVGFKIKIEEIEAAYKLSQNRNAADYAQIVERLREDRQADSRRMGEVMRRLLLEYE